MNATVLALPAPRIDLCGSSPTLVFHRRRTISRDAAIDARLIAILDAPLISRETPAEGFTRKERDLGNAFAQLTIEQASDLASRLAVSFATDVVARKFSKLSEERRERLLDFLDLLADPDRRDALLDAL